MKILLVDDDTDFLDQAKIFLEKGNKEFQVNICESGEEALELLEQKEFDVIVSDYMMPGMGGLEFLERVIYSGIDLPFIMLTGKGREEVAMKALNLGADRYVQKGGDPRSQYGVLSSEIKQEVERYRIKKKLEEREELYKLVTECFYDMIALIDLKKNNILLVSEAVEDLLGYDPDELAGKHFFDMLHPSDRDEVYQMLTELIKSGDSEGIFNDRILCKDGSYKWIENRFKILPDHENKPDKLLLVARDMTRHTMVKAELRALAKKYKNILENAWIALLVIEEDTTISMVNRRFEEISGYTREDIEGKKSWTEFVHEEDLDHMLKYHKKRREDPNLVPKDYEARLINKKGEVRKVLINIERIKGTEKSIAAIMDITDMQRLEDISRGLKESEQVGMLIVRDGFIREVNPCVEQLLGCSEKELIGKDPLTFIPKEEREKVHNISIEVLKGKQHESYEHRFKSKEGDYGWVLEEVSKLRYDGQDAALMIFIDITRNREAKKALERSKKRYSAIVETAFAGICISDMNNDITFVNNTFADMVGYSKEELIGMNVCEITTDEYMCKVQEMTEERSTGVSGVYELELKRKYGGELSVLIQATPIKEKGDKISATLAVITDITERKKLSDREDFLHSLLRHDLKNKVQITRGYLELMEEYPLPEGSKELLTKAKRSVIDEGNLIEKIRKLREIQVISVENSEVISLNKVMGKVITSVKENAEDKGIKIDYRIQDVSVMGGPLLEELFFNLLINAIVHSNASEIVISADITDDHVIIYVEDDGKGIPEELEERIFESGVKGKGSGGTGIGLYLAKEIVKGYNGGIALETSEMGGAKFEVKLRRAPS